MAEAIPGAPAKINQMSTPPATPALRLFVALWPDAATQGAIAAWQQKWSWPPGARLVGAERLHLTLHFLGDVPPHRLPELVSGLSLPFEPTALEFGPGEIWPMGIAVLPVARPPPALAALHAGLGRALEALSLPVDRRPLRPHVTLARRAKGAGIPGERTPLVWPASHGYVLARSLPGGGGYEIVRRFG